jgi:ACR3 family arsenite transporter
LAFIGVFTRFVALVGGAARVAAVETGLARANLMMRSWAFPTTSARLYCQVVPSIFHALGKATVAEVNLPVAVLVWLMIFPMLLKIDLMALREVDQHWRGIATTVGVNWPVKPFSMALLAWIFIAHLFRPWLPADQLNSYVAGLILLAAAPCTAMVFVWSNFVDGEPHFTLSQVALNHTIMVVAFAPIVGLLLGLSAITVPWDTLYFFPLCSTSSCR